MKASLNSNYLVIITQSRSYIFCFYVLIKNDKSTNFVNIVVMMPKLSNEA